MENFSDRKSDSPKLLNQGHLYYFEGFKVVADERRLWYGEELVSLTPKEFDVLFYLVEHAGLVAEKNDLIDTIWGDTFVEESTLALNVSWLRNKLKKVTNGKKIHRNCSQTRVSINC